MNTERHHEQWTPAKQLRHQRVAFVSAGTIGPLDEPEVHDPTVVHKEIPRAEHDEVQQPDVEDAFDHLDNLDGSDGAMAQMSINSDATAAAAAAAAAADADIDVDMSTVADAQDLAHGQSHNNVLSDDDEEEDDDDENADHLITEPAQSAAPQDPLASLFFVDTQGDDSLAFKGPKAALAPRPASPSPSDSSEEVVFRGRNVVVRDDPPKPKIKPTQLPSRPHAPPPPPAPPAAVSPPARISPAAAQAPLEALLQALGGQDEPQVPAEHQSWGRPKPVAEEPDQWNHQDGTASLKQQVWPSVQPQARLDDQLSSVRLGSRKTKKGRKKQNKLFRAELDPEFVDDDILQDYIDNMDSDDAPGGHDSEVDDLFNQLLDHDDVDEKLNPKGDIVGVDTSSGSDSWGTDNGDDDDDDDDDNDDDDEEGDDLDDLDSSDLESELEYNEREQWEDEADLRQRQMDGMTDEEIARLWAKQEELGLGADDMILFDDSGFGDVGAARAAISAFTTPRSGKKNKAPSKRSSGKKSNHFPDASLMADVLDQDPYNGFDVMDFERPSLRSRPKGRKSAGPMPEELGLSDDDLIAEITNSWEKDRSKKAARKAEREEQRKLGLLGSGGKTKKGNKFKPDLSMRYDEGISMLQVRVELRAFLDNDDFTTKAFPPMAKGDRKVLHEIAAKFNLKSKSIGSGKNRAPVLIKTSRTIEFSDEHFQRAQSTVQRGFFRQPGKKGKSDKFAADKNNKRGGGGAGGAAGYMNGEVVGGSAPEIAATNFGRKLMEKMGWQAGMALGKEGNNGLLVPVQARIKSGKAGLG